MQHQHQHHGVVVHDTETFATSLMLSQLDNEEYEKAVLVDSENIMQRHLLPKSIPWCNIRVPLLRNLPRDIEDMKCLWYACDGGDGDLFRSDVNEGPHGFGMFDMNGLRIDMKGGVNNSQVTSDSTAVPTRGQDIINSSPGPSPGKRRVSSSEIEKSSYEQSPFCQSNLPYTASARRSDDPGVIELAVNLPLPSFDAALLKCHLSGSIQKNPWMRYDQRTLQMATDLLTAERAESCSFMPVYWHRIDDGHYHNPPPFFVIDEHFAGYFPETDKYGRMVEEEFYKSIAKRDDRKRKHKDLSSQCVRKWKLSIKVAGVSSRSTLHANSQLYPLYCNATFPTYIQSGQSLTIESALAKDDQEGTRHILGSYDCRYTSINPLMSFDAMMDQGRSKDTSTNSSGRARRINVGRTRQIWTGVQRVSSTKVHFSSLITGQKLDSSSHKRPKEARVHIRLNGTILSTDKPAREHASGEFKWGKDRIRAALQNAFPSSNENSSTTSSNTLHQSPASCNFEAEKYLKKIREEIIVKTGNSKVKKGQSKIHLLPATDSDQKFCVPLLYGAADTLKYFKPRLECYPLEDSFLRVVCTEVGSMNGINVNDFLNDAAKASPDGPLCTICWTGCDTYEVLECASCGLLVHECCSLSEGKRFKTGDDSSILWKCCSCAVAGTYMNKSEERKSQRTFKLPDRFKDSSDIISPGLSHLKRSTGSSRKCSLCPHYGGAMSILKNPVDNNDPSGTHDDEVWAHDVCRIWGTEKGENCCLCGTGANNGTSDCESKDSSKSQQSIQTNSLSGITRCAAVGCQVVFHPTCAVLATRLRKEVCSVRGSSFVKEMTQDMNLSHQYTLSLTEIKRTENLNRNRREGEEKSYIVPIAYCGLHNPKREDSFYGCPPCGRGLQEFIRIPYQYFDFE